MTPSAITLEPLQHQDAMLERVVDIWYHTSLVCHDFIDQYHWQACRDAMRNQYLPMGETVVARYEGEIVGFISLVDDLLAALFVLPDDQGKGIGQALLREAFSKREILSLKVYQKNIAARDFYLKQGFRVVGESLDESTGEAEIVMRWEKAFLALC